jgi:TonB-linked SusC/RagA family outer membrane protein
MISQQGSRAVLVLTVALAFMGLWASPVLAQNTGSIQGTVVDQTTSRPVANAQVSVQGTQLGTITNQQGRFQILNVPVGTHTVVAEIIGYETVSRTVTIRAGEVTSINLPTLETAIALQELVVTGVSGATPRAKLPFTVDQLRTEDMPVPAMSAASMIQGKVAGAQVVQGSGRPGATPSILLRGPTSIDAAGRNQEPLFIVDGVVLGASVIDIDALDIETVEVVKGAAAASLYGARAANGVVQITTRSGRGLDDNTIRYSLRSEYGINQLPGSINIAQLHPYRLDTQGRFVDAAGNPFDWTEEAFIESAYWDIDGHTGLPRGRQPVLDGGVWTAFQRNPWPGQTFDHVDNVMRRGAMGQHQITMEGRQGATNFHASFANVSQEGVVVGQQGYDRNSFRLNLDQGLQDNIQLSTRVFYSRSTTDGQNVEGTGTPLFTLTRMPAGVDIRARDAEGRLLLRPDLQGENANPLIELNDLERSDLRQRFMGGANLRWSPMLWLDLDANMSYDRSDVDRDQFNHKGYRTARPASSNAGYVYRDGWLNEVLTGSLTATLRRSFGAVNTRTQVRYLFEDETYDYFRASGFNLVVDGVRSVTAARDQLITRSTLQDTRSEGYFFITNFDIADRYILDALVRRDGSSLFGADERWQTYYRGSAAWRLSQEDWWFAPGLFNEFKLRYSIGTAGGRPNWSAQYETYTVLDGVVRGAVSLGNTELKPEFAIEHEAGVDFSLLERMNVGITYANTEARDQILRVPQPAVTGFEYQWRNAGTLESNTWEVSIDMPVMRRGDFNWGTRLLFDRTRQQITQLDVPPYQYGIPGVQAVDAAFYAREGERLGTFYGYQWASSCGQLPEGLRGACQAGEFQVNDDGYMVYVGTGNTWRDGITKNLWGTEGPGGVMWGTPIVGVDADGDDFQALGNTTPDFSVSLSNTINWRGFSLYGLIDAVQGADIYNLPRHWAYFERYSGDQDQTNPDPNLHKPIGYYSSLYRILGPPNSHFVEDGSFVKLRELSVRYRFGRDQLGAVPGLRAFQGLGISLVGRNLFTITDYTGYDPEVGIAGGDVGSAAIARFDGFNYPNFRTLTAGIELNF